MCQLAVVRVIKSANHDGRDCTGDGIRYSESAYWAQYKGIGGITGQGGLAMGGNIASRVVRVHTTSPPSSVLLYRCSPVTPPCVIYCCEDLMKGCRTAVVSAPVLVVGRLVLGVQRKRGY